MENADLTPKPSFDYAALTRRSAQDVVWSSRVFVTGLILSVHFDYILSGVPRCFGDAVEGCDKDLFLAS